MGDWTDAYDRLVDAQNSGSSQEEVEHLAAEELSRLVSDD